MKLNQKYARAVLPWSGFSDFPIPKCCFVQLHSVFSVEMLAFVIDSLWIFNTVSKTQIQKSLLPSLGQGREWGRKEY